MTPAARIQATIQCLQLIATSPVPMDTTLGDYFRTRKFIGSKDRADVAARVYDIVRHTARLGWWLAQIGMEDTPRARVMVWLVQTDPRKLSDLFDGSKYGPEKISADEQAALDRLSKVDAAAMPQNVRAECPPEHEQRLQAVFKADFETEMAAMLQVAPLDLRVNVGKITRENAAGSLAKDGVETDPAPYSPWGLRCRTKAHLSKTKALTKGWVDIQDEGSQLIAAACAAQPGMQVLDFCAGAGGKTLALAAAMQNKGRIVAMDTEVRRLEKARPRFKRAGVTDIIEVRPLSDEKNKKWLRRQKGTFDLVLTDVPCSGSGTWRRNPDTRWRHYGPSLEDLLVTQAEILDRVAAAVKPGGRLVYATCSLFEEENEAQIESFLKRHTDFDVENAGAVLGMPFNGEFMRLSPQKHNTDGFFAAILKKLKDS